MRHPYWARREIDTLDAERDARRIAHLIFEVLYGSPVFIQPLFSLAFARQVAIAPIASVLHRNGTGIILSDTAKRNDDTLVFFGLLLRHGDSPEGQRIVDRINHLHAHYPIPNDLSLYTLATLACLPARVGRQFTGRELLTPKQNDALYFFWRRIGEMMGIVNIPDSSAKFLQWMLDYEASEYRHTRQGQEVTQALAREFARRWFPARWQRRGERLFLALFDEHLCATHQLEQPSTFDRHLVRLAFKAFIAVRRILPDPAEQDLVMMFGPHYGPTPSHLAIGPQDTPQPTASVMPAAKET